MQSECNICLLGTFKGKEDERFVRKCYSHFMEDLKNLAENGVANTEEFHEFEVAQIHLGVIDPPAVSANI